VRKYGVPFQHIILDDDVDFEEQVKLFATTGVLVSVHGAGLMNQIFMPPGSVTIEVFPNHVKHVLYERVAHYAGVYHFKVCVCVCGGVRVP
jgi:capsular polysaccharide biosynthesis protein